MFLEKSKPIEYGRLVNLEDMLRRIKLLPIPTTVDITLTARNSKRTSAVGPEFVLRRLVSRLHDLGCRSAIPLAAANTRSTARVDTLMVTTWQGIITTQPLKREDERR
jgi:hypothetical protein